MRVKFFVSLTLLLVLVFLPMEADAHEHPPLPIEVIFLVDVSGSMRFTDPDRIVLSAIADIIDKLEPHLSRVGIIGFNGQVQHRIPFMYVDEEKKDWLRDELSRFVYVGYTDIGLAFMYALEMIEDVTELNNPMFIFISDGYIQISRLNPRRTAQMSYADIESALDALDGMVPIYTIGMHNPDGIDVPLLEMISQRSGGLSKFTYHADELPGILAAIFEHHVERSRIYMPEPASEIIYEDDEEPEIKYEEEYDAVEDEEPFQEYEEEIVEEAENNGFALGVLHYLAMFFGMTALLGVLRVISLVM